VPVVSIHRPIESAGCFIDRPESNRRHTVGSIPQNSAAAASCVCVRACSIADGQSSGTLVLLLLGSLGFSATVTVPCPSERRQESCRIPIPCFGAGQTHMEF
jgi:hypothetical protein